MSAETPSPSDLQPDPPSEPPELSAADADAQGASLGPRRATKRLKRKRWKRRLSALAFGCLLCLALTECGVRVLWKRLVIPSEAPLVAGSGASLGRALIEESLRGPGDSLKAAGASDPLYTWDPRESLRHKPGVTLERALQGTPIVFHVTTDANGLRGPHPPAREGELKVLCLGDSMTFGQGVSDAECFPARLSGLLEARLGRPVRVFNAGVISLGQQEQFALAERLIPRLRPDLVLLQFTVANDVMDDQRWQDERGPESELIRSPEACGNLEFHLLLTTPLARWSRAYRLAIWRWGRHAIRYRYMVEAPNVTRAAQLLVSLRQACRDASGRPIPTGVLIAPSVVQVERGLAERLLDTQRINTRVRETLDQAGIPTLDLLAALQAAHGEGRDLYIPVDRHWNAEGNAVVAAEAAAFAQQVWEARPQ